MRCALSRSASLLALAAMLASLPSPAVQAQSFNATGTITTGSGAIDVGTPGQTTVVIDTASAVIDWNTNEPAGSGPINFQPLGTTATFENRGTPDFTVLNRIIPNDITRPAQFNGTVISQLSNAAAGTVTRGGTLFFYSPGGILVGPTGVFNVGNLVLTASDLTVDPVTGSFGTGGTYSFRQANLGSRVQISSGAQITAGPDGAFVALVAPRVINGGVITVDGSTVIVAADASTITFRPSGLFDIQIDQGTSETGTVVTNTGTITGPAATAAAAHRVYMVAVPKNDAITMAIQSGSSLGFAVAGAADVDGNAIVLSAGFDVVNGTIEATRSLASAPVSAGIAIGAITATSQVTAQASGVASVSVQNGTAGTFASNVSLAGLQSPSEETNDAAFITVTGVGSVLDISGNLTLRSQDAGAISANTPSDSTPARVLVSRGELSVQGNLTIDASRTGFDGNDVTGGQTSLLASNGAAVNVGGNLVLNSDGVGEATGNPAQITTGSATGGFANVSVAAGATIDVTGNTTVQARGFGGEALDGPLIGGDGTGGFATIQGGTGGGTISVGGTLGVLAGGTGADGNFCTFCGIEGGSGFGGSASIDLTPAMNLTVNQAIAVDAAGRGGAASVSNGQGGGSGIGGVAFVGSSGGTLTARSSLAVRAFGVGGVGALDDLGVSGSTGFGGPGGDGIGGAATLQAGNAGVLGGGGSITITGATDVLAYGVGGQGGNGGAGLGGNASVSGRNGSVSGAVLGVLAYGTGGASASGGLAGEGLGGGADVIAYSAVEGSSNVTFAATSIDAGGNGGAGSAPILLPDVGSSGGAGTGGQAQALAEAGNGVLNLGPLVLRASGFGGAGGTGGSAISITPGGAGGAGGAGTGGTVNLGVVAGLATGAAASGSASFGATSASASASGGLGGAGGSGSVTGAAGAGGSAVAGSANLTVQGATVAFGATATIAANAVGGAGGSGTGAGGGATVGSAGGGTGGVSLSVAGGGSLEGTDLLFRATSEGGKGGSDGPSTLLGQPLRYLLDGGTVSAGNLDFRAAGTPSSGAAPSVIALAGGNTTVSGAFYFETPGTLSTTFDGADVLSADATISADAWLPGAAPLGTPGTLFGTSSVVLLSNGDLFGHLSVNSGAALAIGATGLVRLDNLSAAADITVTAGSTVSLGNLAAGSPASLALPGNVSVGAPGNVTVGTVSATGAVSLQSAAALVAGAVTAGEGVVLDGVTSLSAGALQAGDSALLSSGGTIAAGAISAGLVNPSVVSGATYNITVSGAGNLTLGALSAAHDIALFTPAAVTAGALAGREISVLSGGAQTLASIAASGRVLLADYSMLSIGGDPLDDYDLDALLSAVPTATAGAITVSGTTNAGALSALSRAAISLGDVTTVAAGSADGRVFLQARGALGAGNIAAGGLLNIVSSATIDLGDAAAASTATFSAAQGMTVGAILAQGNIIANAGGGLTTGDVTSVAGEVGLQGVGDVAIGSVIAGSLADIASNTGNTTLGNVTTGTGNLTVAGNIITAGNLASGGGDLVVVAGSSLTTGALTSLDRAFVQADGSVATGDVSSANGQVLITAGGALTAGDLSSGASGPGGVGLRASSGTSLTVGNASAATGELRLTSGGAMAAGDLAASDGFITLTSGGAAETGALSGTTGITLDAAGAATVSGPATSSAGAISLLADGDLAATGITAGGAVLAQSSAGAVTVQDVTAGGALSLLAATDLAAGALNAGGDLTAGGRGVTLGDVDAAKVGLSATGALGFGDVTATGDVALSADGAITGGSITTTGSRIALSNNGGAVSLGDVAAAGTVQLLAQGDLGVGTVSSGTGTAELRATNGSLSVGNITAGTVTLVADGDLAATGITAGGAVLAQSSAGAVTVQDVTAGGALSLLAATDLAAGALNAGGDLTAGGRGVTLGDVDAAKVGLSATGALGFGDVTATGDVALSADGAITGGSITTTGSRIALSNNGGAVSLGDVAAAGTVQLLAQGDLGVGTVSAGTGTAELRATNGSLTAGNITAGTTTALIASDDLTTGAVQALDILLLAGGNIRAASLTSSGAGRILAASNTMSEVGGAIGAFDVDAVFAARLAATGGGITVTGPITGDSFTAAVSGDATLGGIAAARSILVDAGGTARLGGVWRSPLITLTANDLVMPAGSGLNAGLAGTISLISRNAAGMRIGDGLDGSLVPATAFSLDNGEWSRINSGSLSVFGRDVAGAVDILIGKLDVTGPDAGSTIDDPTGSVRFSTGASPTAAPSGTVRVAGALEATGFRSGNALVFRTGQFQLASDTGSLAILGTGTALSGSLQIEAGDIHVASTSLLARLAADPFFAGVEPALDQESVGGSGPVVRAGALDFTVGRSFYIQRIGTGTDPLGFEEPVDGFRVRRAGAGLISVIINGTFRTAGGLVSGVDAWQLFKDSSADLSGFTADSRLNGCLLSAATCGPDVPVADPVPEPDPGFRTLVDLLKDPPLDDAPGEPDDRDPAVQSAILPPAMLLPVQPDVLPGAIDEPIAGSGNPALTNGTGLEGTRP